MRIERGDDEVKARSPHCAVEAAVLAPEAGMRDRVEAAEFVAHYALRFESPTEKSSGLRSLLEYILAVERDRVSKGISELEKRGKTWKASLLSSTRRSLSYSFLQALQVSEVELNITEESR